MGLYEILIAAALFGFLAGLSKFWLPIAPWLASALAVIGFATLVIAAGAWAASCWDCAYGHEDTRGVLFTIWAILGGGIALVLIAGALGGAGISVVIRHLTA